MGRETTQSWEYMLDPAYGFDGVPLLDIQQDFRLQRPGTLSKSSGIDGRYKGKWRRFPGFAEYISIPQAIGGDNPVIWGAAGGESIFKYFAVQKDVALSPIIRGFVFLGRDGTNDKLYGVYSMGGDALSSAILYDFGADVDFIDVWTDHRHLYVVGADTSGNKIEQQVRYDNGSAAWVAMPISYSSDESGTPAGSDYTTEGGSAGKLENSKTYSVAYRLYFPEQRLYTPLSKIHTVTIGASDDVIKLTGIDPTDYDSGVDNASRCVCQTYRTVASDYATASVRGTLYLEDEFEWPDKTGDPDSWPSQTIYWGLVKASPKWDGLNDDALQFQPSLSTDEVAVFEAGNPKAKRIAIYEDLMVVGTAPKDQDDARDTEVLRWSFADRDRFNMLPISNRRIPADLTDQLQSLTGAGPFLAAVYDNSILRLHRSGSRLAIDTIHNWHGSVGRWAALSVGTELYLASPVGILIVDLVSGQVNTIGATQHFFDETGNWRNNLDTIHAAYDSKLGVLVFHNTALHESILIWMNHGVISTLELVPWDDVAMGPDIYEGGIKQSYWMLPISTPETPGSPFSAGFSSGFGGESTGYLARIMVFNSDRSAETYSTMGVGSDVTLNTTTSGKISGGISSQVGMQAGDILTYSMIGHYLSVVSGSAAGESRKIVAVSPDAEPPYVTVSPPFSTEPVDGDRVAIASIPFRLRFWPLSGHPDRPGLLALFREKSVYSAMAALGDMAGSTSSSNPNLYLKYVLYERDLDTVAVSAEGSMLQQDTSGLNAATAAALDHVGNVVVPGVECWSADLDFSLLGVVFDGEPQPGRYDVRPA